MKKELRTEPSIPVGDTNMDDLLALNNEDGQEAKMDRKRTVEMRQR